MKLIWFVCCLLWMQVGMVSADTLSIDEFSRDRVLFDVGAAFGRDAAMVRVAGTGVPQAQVDLRLVNDRTGGWSQWRAVAQVNADGRWAGALTLNARQDWFRIEVRSQGETAATRYRFGTGDVVAILGQSEFERLWLPGFDALGAGSSPAAHSDQVQFTLRRPHTGVTHHFTDATATQAMNALATFWIANAPPGRKLHVVDLAESGTTRLQLQDDADDRRKWSDLADVLAFLARDHVHVGLVLESWFAGERSVGLDWAEVFMPLYAGVTLRGQDVVRGSRGRNGISFDNFLWDVSGGDEGVFEVGETALGIFGPHRFDSDARLTGAVVKADGEMEYGLLAIERSRAGVAAFRQAAPMQDIFVDVVLPQPLDYANGFVDTATGAFIDSSHPSYVTADGQQRLAKHTANAALVALGHQRYDIPTFDQISWRRGGIEVSSSAGPITTARRVRGLPPLGDALPHWTDVLGFEVNGRAIERAEITRHGAVMLYPAPDTVFKRGDVVSFGKGGAGGFMQPVQDWLAAAYLNYPIVDVGLVGLEGVAVTPGLSVTLR